VVTVTITIGLPSGTRLLAADTERRAAQYAEAIIYSAPSRVLPVPLSVSCADPAMKRRLTDYLADLQTECICMRPMHERGSPTM
jgi:hypothetical protein